ncbi:MAG: hypothetical protein ACRDKL_09965, partial [Solirubrobacteraceae bacterium]
MEVPFALFSVQKVVNSIGAYVGFAAFIAVAILILIYFSQARETASLRERLQSTEDRAAGLEARIAQLVHLQVRRPVAIPVAPAPVPP